MIKQILKDQIKDKIKRSLALYIFLLTKLLDEKLEEEEKQCIMEMCQGLPLLTRTMINIQDDNIEPYKDLVFELGAKDEQSGNN